MKNICVIPARGGSKRIPKKNLKDFKGKPIILWSLEISLKSDLFDEIIVSTDDSEIAQIALDFGVQVPFIRSSELSDEFTPTILVVRDVIERLDLHLEYSDNVCCLYPTAPFVRNTDLSESLSLLDKNKNFFVFPVVEFASSPQRALTLTENGFLKSLFPENVFERSQDLNKTYFDAGQFYWATKRTWLNIDNIHNNAIGFPLPKWQTVDINDAEDWDMAENYFSILKDKGHFEF